MTTNERRALRRRLVRMAGWAVRPRPAQGAIDAALSVAAAFGVRVPRSLRPRVRELRRTDPFFPA